jgi:hypothetical protein
MQQILLEIRLRLEALITERAGMVAENMQRKYLGQSMAYGEDDFNILANQITYLITMIKD